MKVWKKKAVGNTIN